MTTDTLRPLHFELSRRRGSIGGTGIGPLLRNRAPLVSEIWCPIARNLRHMRPTPSDYWYLDEMVIVIRGRRHWLRRAVGNEGEVLGFLVQSKQNARAALKLLRKLLKKQGWAPTRITTDRLRSYHAAIRTLGLTASMCGIVRARQPERAVLLSIAATFN